MGSINDARFTMMATVIPRLVTQGETPTVPNQEQGHYEYVSDPDSGEVRTVFVLDTPITNVKGFTPPGQTDSRGNALASQFDIKCYARAYTALGYRSSANRESFIAGDYAELEAIQFDFPKTVTLNHQTLVTNIRGSGFESFWINPETGQPTVWECQGASPVHDPFGKWIRNTTVLKRSEVQ